MCTCYVFFHAITMLWNRLTEDEGGRERERDEKERKREQKQRAGNCGNLGLRSRAVCVCVCVCVCLSVSQSSCIISVASDVIAQRVVGHMLSSHLGHLILCAAQHTHSYRHL